MSFPFVVCFVLIFKDSSGTLFKRKKTAYYLIDKVHMRTLNHFSTHALETAVAVTLETAAAVTLETAVAVTLETAVAVILETAVAVTLETAVAVTLETAVAVHLKRFICSLWLYSTICYCICQHFFSKN